MIDKSMYFWTRKEVAEKLSSANTYGRKEQRITSLVVYQGVERYLLIVAVIADKPNILSLTSKELRNSIRISIPTLKNLRTVWSPTCGGTGNSVIFAVESSSFSQIWNWIPASCPLIDGDFTVVISEI